jgi:hypothetical protein
MQKQSFHASEALPTIYRAYKPIEEYLEALHEADDAPVGVPVTPVDALSIHLLVSMCAGRPTLVDLAGEATHGASTVLCYTQSKAGKVVQRQSCSQGNSTWRSILARFLDHCEASCLIAPQIVQSSDPLQEPHESSELSFGLASTIVVTAAADEAPQELVGRVRLWLERSPDLFVFVLALGETGQCEYLKSLADAFDSDSPQRFVLLREQAAALHSSTLGLIYNRAHPYLDHLLARLAKLFTGNFSFLSLLKGVCEEAIRKADVDNSILETHPLGPQAGIRRRIAELEHTLASRDHELAELRRWSTELHAAVGARDHELVEVRRRNWELECALGALNQHVQHLSASLAFKVGKRFQRVRTIAAPEGTIRYRVFRKMLGLVRVCRSEGLRGLLLRARRTVIGSKTK